MNILTTRTQVKPEGVATVEEAARRLFAAMERSGLGGGRCASTRLDDGVTFLTLLFVEGDNPLPGFAAYREFQEALRPWVAAPPVAERPAVVATYRLFEGEGAGG